MIHTMNLNPSPFEQIRDGRKTVELRLFDEKRRKLDIGDTIVFTNSKSGTRLTATIIAIYRYATFEDLFREIKPERCGFEAGISVEEAARGMEEYYTQQQVKDYGVVGIRLELVSLEETERKREEDVEWLMERLFPDGMK